jgi:uncharacterized phage protein (TIGR02218 family)
MKNVPAALAALFASGADFHMADIVLIWSTLPASYTPGAPCTQNNFGAPGPILLALTNADVDLAILPDAVPASNCTMAGSGIYLAQGVPPAMTPNGLPTGAIYCSAIPMDRTKLSCKCGIDVDKMQVTLYPRANDTIFGGSLNSAFRAGTFDGSTAEVYRMFWSKASPVTGGGLIIFVGRMGEADPIGRSKITFTINSYNELLNLDFPTRVYQGFCDFQLYGPGCCVNRASYTYTVTVLASPPPGTTFFAISGGIPDNWLTQGTFLFPSGACQGESGTIKVNGSGVVEVFTPLPAAPSGGDAVTVYAGCDHSYTTCQSKFNNLSNFPQCPFIPIPQTMLPPIVQNSDSQKQG